MTALKILLISAAGGSMVSLFLENILSKEATIFAGIIIVCTLLVSLAEIFDNLPALVCGSSVTAVFFGFLIEETGSDIAVMGKFVFFLLFISAAHIVQFFSRTD